MPLCLCDFVPLCLCAFAPLLHSTRPKQISAHPCSNMPDARHGPCCLLPPPKQTTDAPMVWMSARVVHRRSRKNNIEEMHKLGALLKDSDESACFCTPGSSKSSCLWRHSLCFFWQMSKKRFPGCVMPLLLFVMGPRTKLMPPATQNNMEELEWDGEFCWFLVATHCQWSSR